MNRRFCVFFTAFTLVTVVGTAAWAQSSSRSMSLAERMAALRRGWSSDDAQNERNGSRTTKSQSSDDGAESGGLLNRWFGGDDDEDQARPTGRARTNTNQQPRMAVRPRTGSVPQQPRSAASPNMALPGLGGSPLPQGQWKLPNGATTGDSAAQEVATDYPVIRDTAESKPATKPARQTTTARAEPPTPTRRSPNARPTPRIDPAQLRRELAGSFPADGNTTPRTARAEDRNPADEASSVSPLVVPSTQTTADNAISASPEPLRLEQSPARTTSIADEPRSASEAFGVTPSEPSSIGVNQFSRSPQSTSPAEKSRKQAFGEALQAANGGDPTLLVSNQAPVITADIRGPKQILIGREAVYRVRLQNQGSASAEEVVANIRIPSWADVVGSNATKGAVQPSQNAATPSQLEWQIDRLDGRASESLDIRLVPRESRPLELGISWTVAPVGSRAIVEVQEPKLDVQVTGPSEVLYGKPQVFQLTLSNPGTGPADGVRIELIPPGASQESVTSHPVGSLRPGDSKTIEIELTAREAGKLQIQAIASAEGGLSSDVAKEVFCRKPELELDWRGPATKYAGTPTTYFFRVRNPGTAPAEDVSVEVALPQGAEFTSASEGQSYDAQRRRVTWRVGTLKPGDDHYMELKCVIKAAGINQFQIAAAAAGGELTDSAVAETNVVALADLKLEVSDPRGPVAVGAPANYEIRIANRGANVAKDVQVVVLFSEGIEPDKADGAMYTVADGRVAFTPIAELPAGQEVTLRIRAHAVSPGTHVFRAEVLCEDADIKLAAEETTRFYADEVRAETETGGDQSAGRYGFESAVR